jgi:riboflavin kinase/FMN adenylyltransferase
MIIIRTTSELPPGKGKLSLAIGFFDGVHLGHQQIIRQTLADARQHDATALVITFDRHPNTVVAPERAPLLIYSLSQKLRMIETLGVDVLWLIGFDTGFSRQTGEQFVRRLHQDLGPIRSICVGANFLFGYRRSGNVDLLRKLGAELKFVVHGVAAVALDGKAVSSTRIRQAILAGQLDAANQMLGRPYALSGKVIPGDGLGRKLGFATANIDAAGLVLPPKGVYAVRADVCGKIFRAVLNMGYRPTLKKATPQVRVEAHLLDFQGELYGKELGIEFVEKLRDERKFASLDELRHQIDLDVVEARSRF